MSKATWALADLLSNIDRLVIYASYRGPAAVRRTLLFHTVSAYVASSECCPFPPTDQPKGKVMPSSVDAASTLQL